MYHEKVVHLHRAALICSQTVEATVGASKPEYDLPPGEHHAPNFARAIPTSHEGLYSMDSPPAQVAESSGLVLDRKNGAAPLQGTDARCGLPVAPPARPLYDHPPAAYSGGLPYPETCDMTGPDANNPSVGKGFDYPCPSQSLDSPSQSFDNPSQDRGFDYPCPSQSLDNPSQRRSFDYPCPSQSLDNPSQERGFDYPSPSQSLDNPSQGRGFDYPSPSQSLDNPSQGRGFDYPCPSRSLENPSQERGFDYPCPSQLLENPSEGRGFDYPPCPPQSFNSYPSPNNTTELTGYYRQPDLQSPAFGPTIPDTGPEDPNEPVDAASDSGPQYHGDTIQNNGSSFNTLEHDDMPLGMIPTKYDASEHDAPKYDAPDPCEQNPNAGHPESPLFQPNTMDVDESGYMRPVTHVDYDVIPFDNPGGPLGSAGDSLGSPGGYLPQNEPREVRAPRHQIEVVSQSPRSIDRRNACDPLSVEIDEPRYMFSIPDETQIARHLPDHPTEMSPARDAVFNDDDEATRYMSHIPLAPTSLHHGRAATSTDTAPVPNKPHFTRNQSRPCSTPDASYQRFDVVACNLNGCVPFTDTENTSQYNDSVANRRDDQANCLRFDADNSNANTRIAVGDAEKTGHSNEKPFGRRGHEVNAPPGDGCRAGLRPDTSHIGESGTARQTPTATAVCRLLPPVDGDQYTATVFNYHAGAGGGEAAVAINTRAALTLEPRSPVTGLLGGATGCPGVLQPGGRPGRPEPRPSQRHRRHPVLKYGDALDRKHLERHQREYERAVAGRVYCRDSRRPLAAADNQRAAGDRSRRIARYEPKDYMAQRNLHGYGDNWRRLEARTGDRGEDRVDEKGEDKGEAATGGMWAP